MADVPFWRGSQRQSGDGFAGEGPAGTPVQFPQPSKQHNFIDNATLKTTTMYTFHLKVGHKQIQQLHS